MKVLYIDLSNSGISGDMFLASLLGLISDPEKIIDDLKELKELLPDVSKLDIKLIINERSGIQTNQLKIDVKESKIHRTANVLKKYLNEFLNKKEFSDSAKLYAKKVLDLLIQAEIEVHGENMDKLHLHELSSVDTLIDILGVTKILDIIGAFENNLQISCGKIPLGGGTIKTTHGELPVPAPATVKILEKSKLITHGGPIESELVTPTGVALLANLNPVFSNYPSDIKMIKVVYGSGQKQFTNFLNVLRLFYGESEEMGNIREIHPLEKYVESVVELETDVDDISGEILGNFVRSVATKDILDVQIIPSITKKNRPGHVIKIICRPEHKFKIIEKMIEELGTLGVRFNAISRVCIDRQIEMTKINIKGKMYDLRYKISFIKSEEGKKIINIKPEYEDLKKISEDSGIPVKKILLHAQAQFNINKTFLLE